MKPLYTHLIINDDYAAKGAGQLSKLLDYADIDYIQVKDFRQFTKILDSLKDDLKIHIWIHPGFAKQMETREKHTSGMLAAMAMKDSKIPFHLLTSQEESELAKQYASAYDMKPVGILQMNSHIEGFLPRKVAEIKRMIGNPSEGGGEPGHQDQGISNFDIAIITALYDAEMQSVRNLIPGDWNDHKMPAGILVQSLAYKLSNGKTINILAATQPQTGMTDAAILCAGIITEYRPRYVIMTGVCGGKPDKIPAKPTVNFGDIVIPLKTFNAYSGKVGDNGLEHDMQVCETNPNIINIVHRYKTAILRSIMDTDTSRDYSKKHLQLHIESMACSPVVVDAQGHFQKFSEQDRKTIAVEMESYAIMRTCMILNNGKTHGIIIKSVMDKTMHKTDDSKHYAGFTSALFCKHLLEFLPYD